jgi:plasmid stabilization system protein ParE
MPAAEDLERICERIERDNPEAARRVARAIYDGCARLEEFPHLGRASKAPCSAKLERLGTGLAQRRLGKNEWHQIFGARVTRFFGSSQRARGAHFGYDAA